MDTAEAGRKGGKKSGETRLVKGREAIVACKSLRELLVVVQRLEYRAFMRGYQSHKRKIEKRAMKAAGA